MDMTLFPVLEFDALSEDQKVFWRHIVDGPRRKSLSRSLKSLPGPFNPWLQIPALGQRAADVGESLRFNSILPGDLREIAILTAGVHWKAEYEFWAHARLAKAEGVDEAVLQALRDGLDPPFATENQRLVHSAATEILETGRISPGARCRVASALGWPATVELVTLLGYYSLVSFTLNAFDVDLPDGVPAIWARGGS
jgi:4-carboxymuconolactone decarboxylase